MVDFTQEELEAEAVTADDIVPATEEQGGQPRDESGRFAPTAEDVGEAIEHAAQQQQQRRTVPHAALHAEREGHKATKTQLAAAQAQLQQLAELRARLSAQPAAAAPVAPAAPQAPAAEGAQPAPQDDPNGIKHLTERMAQFEQQNRQFQAQQAEQGIASQEQTVLHNQLIQSEQEFRAATPDYDQASQHLIQARARQLTLMGLGPVEVQQHLADEVLEITRAAIEQGRSPAEVAYEWAQTYGYQSQQAAPAQQPQAPNPMLAAIAQGQKQNRTLATGRGAAGADQINADAIARMDEGEFQRLYNTPQGRALIDSLG